MAAKVSDEANSIFSSIGAIQTLIENFPMNLISFGGAKFASSFDVISILFKILGKEAKRWEGISFRSLRLL